MNSTIWMSLGFLVVFVVIIACIAWFLHRSGMMGSRQGNLFSSSIFQIDHRRYLDTKRALLQIRDQQYIYTILLGEQDLLLDKRPVDQHTVSLKSE